MSDVAAATAAQPAAQSASGGLPLWSHGSFSFKDFLDIVNPLQHIPVIGSIYRYLTGDEPSGGARIVGDSIYGGPIGFGISVVSTALFTDSKGDLGEKALASVFGSRDGSPPPGTPAIAATQPAPSSAPVNAAAASGAPTPLAAVPPQPVAMNQLFRSAPPAAPATPEQAFLAQNSQFQRQINTGRGTNGTVLNSHPVPLELSSNLLPVAPAASRPTPPATAPAASPAPASTAAAMATAPNPIAQKMLDALDKYEQLKRQEEQEDNAAPGTAPRVNLAL